MTDKTCLSCGTQSPCGCDNPAPADEVYARHADAAGAMSRTDLEAAFRELCDAVGVAPSRNAAREHLSRRSGTGREAMFRILTSPKNLRLLEAQQQ